MKTLCSLFFFFCWLFSPLVFSHFLSSQTSREQLLWTLKWSKFRRRFFRLREGAIENRWLIYFYLFFCQQNLKFLFFSLLMLLLTSSIYFGDHVEFNFCLLGFLLGTWSWTMLVFFFFFVSFWSNLVGLSGALCLLFIVLCVLRRFWWHQISVNFTVVI